MIKVLDSDYNLQAILHEVFDATVSEGVNREYEAFFSISRDDPKADFIGLDSIIEIDGDYFYISKYSKRLSPSADLIDVECEHLSYLLNEEAADFFGMTGNPSAILSSILDDTVLEVGTVEFSGEILFAIEEETTKRQLLILFAETLGGELEYDGFSVNIIDRRGVDDGKQFRVGKNILGVNYEVDRDKVAVDVDVLELQNKDLEEIKLGDTRRLIIPHLGIDEETRVKRYEYNPIKRKNSNVELTNFIDDLSDDLISIRTGSVQKDRLYNGIRVGPEVGFLAQRNDNLVRTRMNATEGFSIQSRSSESDQWEDRLSVGIDGQLVLNTEQVDGIQSSINVLSDEINLKVENLEDEISSQVTILEDEISLQVSNLQDEISSQVTILQDQIDLRVTSTDFNSAITVLEDKINLEVSNLEDDISSAVTVLQNQINLRVTTQTFNNEISVLEDQIDLKVSESDYNGNTIVSRINLSSTTATIQASRINLVGAVTVLSDITGDLGTITAGTVNGLQVNSANIDISENMTIGETLFLTGSGQRGITFSSGARIFAPTTGGFASLTITASDVRMDDGRIVLSGNNTYLGSINQNNRVLSRSEIIDLIDDMT